MMRSLGRRTKPPSPSVSWSITQLLARSLFSMDRAGPLDDLWGVWPGGGRGGCPIFARCLAKAGLITYTKQAAQMEDKNNSKEEVSRGRQDAGRGRSKRLNIRTLSTWLRKRSWCGWCAGLAARSLPLLTTLGGVGIVVVFLFPLQLLQLEEWRQIE